MNILKLTWILFRVIADESEPGDYKLLTDVWIFNKLKFVIASFILLAVNACVVITMLTLLDLFILK